MIGAIGADVNESAMLARFPRETVADAVMPAGRYTLLDQSAPDDLLPAEGMKDDCQDAPSAPVARARAISEVRARRGTTVPAAAIAFPRRHPSIIDVTLGMRTPEQVGRNVELHDQQVPDGLWDDLRAQGLIRSDVLTGHGGGRDERCL
ncbi:hypothetical protein [Streptomyces azureus]|uniref:Oxidoreductase n=1 Tax=Streptomyces azureus TaxID=146537 RepID=A0A0K8PQY5_STRAJ|nr:oxidoreductase [Streptomyces azureus]